MTRRCKTYVACIPERVLPARAALLLLLVLLVQPAAGQPADPAVVPVVPHPQVVEPAAGAFPIDPARTALRHAADTAGLGLALADLADAYLRLTGAAPANGAAAPLPIHVGLPDRDPALRTAARAAGLWPDDRLGPEGYALSVGPDGVLLAAPTPAGLFYGVQTLKQLLRAHASSGAVPSVRIADWPDLRWRGVMDDISRGPVPTLAFMKAQIRRLAELKINLLTYYTEHVVATRSHPAFAPPDGALTIEEWRELAAYARRYHIDLVGNFQSFGHFEKILAHPAYAPLGENGRMLSPVKPESIAFLRDIYDELVPAFDAPFFHVNSDETFDLGRGASRARVDSLGAGVVYAEHIRNLDRLLEPHDVRMMLWADMVLQHPEALDLLPRDAVLMTWVYDPLDDFTPWITPLRAAGFDVMVCPGVLNSNRLLPDFRQALPNIAGFIADGVEHGASGALTTVWDDGGLALFSVDWYGVAFGADQSWRSAPDAAAHYPRRFDTGLYGAPDTGLSRVLDVLVSIAELEPTDGLNDRVLWRRVVPEPGESLRLSLDGWAEVAARADSALALLDAGGPLRYPADAEALRLVAERYRYLADLRFGLVDAARAYRSAALDSTVGPAAVRALVVDALDRLAGLHAATLRARDAYATRWLRENRTYALDIVTDRYDARLAALADARTRVAEALRSFDMGRPLPPPADVRLGLEVATGKYFLEWLVLGPLPHPGGAAEPPPDYLGGDEGAVRPGVTEEVVYDDATYRWHRIVSPLFDVVDLAALYPDRNTDAALYAYATLDSPDARTVRALLGSDDGVDVFLNGEHVYGRHGARALRVDEDEVRLPLQAGRNHLVLKLSQGDGGWGFTLRLPDENVRSRKNRYRIVE